MCITAFTSARHLSLYWSRSIHSMPPYPTSWRSIIIFSSLYNWVFQAVSFPQVSQLILCMDLSSPHTCYMPCPSYSSLHYVIKFVIEDSSIPDMTPCWLLKSYRRLGEACCLHLHWRTVRTLNFEAGSVYFQYVVALMTNTAGCAELNSETNDWGEVMKLVTLFHRVWSLWEVTSRSANQKIQDLVKYPKDHYGFCKILLLACVPSLFSPENTLITNRVVSLEEFGWWHS